MSNDQSVAQAKQLLRLVAASVDNVDFSLYNRFDVLAKAEPDNLKVAEAMKLARDLFRLNTATSLSQWASAYEGIKALHASNPQDPVFARPLAKNLDALVSEYRDDGQMDKAKIHIEELLDLSHRFAQDEEIGRRLARSLVAAANGYADEKRFAQSEELFYKLLSLYGQHQSSVRIAYNLVQGLVNIGINCRQAGRLSVLRDVAEAFRLGVATRQIGGTGVIEDIEGRLERLIDRYHEDRGNLVFATDLAEFLVFAADAYLSAGRFDDVDNLYADEMLQILLEHHKSHDIWLNAAGFLFIARIHLEANGRRQAAADSRDTFRRLAEDWTSVFKESDSPAPLVDTGGDLPITLPSEPTTKG